MANRERKRKIEGEGAVIAIDRKYMREEMLCCYIKEEKAKGRNK